MKNNRIPRVFNRIVGKYAYVFVSMLRNKEVFELIEIS